MVGEHAPRSDESIIYIWCSDLQLKLFESKRLTDRVVMRDVEQSTLDVMPFYGDFDIHPFVGPHDILLIYTKILIIKKKIQHKFKI